MRFLGVILLTLLMVTTVRSQGIAEWQQQVLFHAEFGNGSDEYGSLDIEASEFGPIRVVSCFTVSQDHILIFDWAKRDIKIYSHSGDYLRKIDASVKKGPVRQGVRARDIAEVDGDIYLLTDFSGQPVDQSVEWSRFQVFTFSTDTGEMRNRYFVNSQEGVEMGTRRVGDKIVPARGSVIFQSARDGLNLFDVTSQESRSFIREGKLLPNEKNASATEIDQLDQQHLRTNRETGEVELLGAGGDVVRVVGKGSVIASSDDRQCYAVLTGRDVVIVDEQGVHLGRMPVERRKAWPLERVGMHNRYRFGVGGDTIKVFEIVVMAGGVELIQWSE